MQRASHSWSAHWSRFADAFGTRAGLVADGALLAAFLVWAGVRGHLRSLDHAEATRTVALCLAPGP